MTNDLDRQAVECRLRELEAERETGAKMMADLDAKRTRLGETLLRIDGAIEVLRELLASSGGAAEAEADDTHLELVRGSAVAHGG
jgi:hypothetical protein